MCLGINLQPNEQEDDIILFNEVSTKNQDSLVAYCKKKLRQMHTVKTGEVNCQIAKRFAKTSGRAAAQLARSLSSFKGVSWFYQQYYSPRFWKTPMKARGEFAKIEAHTNQKTFVKEQIVE